MILILIFILLFAEAFFEICFNIKNKRLFIITYLLLSGIILIRYGVGADYPMYYATFYEISPVTEADINFINSDFHGEPGYLFLISVFRWLGLEFYQFSIFIGSITMFLFYRFFKKFCNYSFVSLFIFYAVYYIVFPFNVIRQGLTLSLFLGVLLPLLLNKRYYIYIIITLIGSLFHYSLLCILFLPLIINIKITKIILRYIIIISLLFPLEQLFASFNVFSIIKSLSYYEEDSKNIMALLNRIIFIIPAFFIYWKSESLKERKIALICIFGFLIFLNFFSYSLISSRISVYFKATEIALCSIFFQKINIHNNKIILLLLLTFFLIIIFIKALNTDLTYLKYFNNIPDHYNIIDYPILNFYFQ